MTIAATAYKTPEAGAVAGFPTSSMNEYGTEEGKRVFLKSLLRVLILFFLADAIVRGSEDNSGRRLPGMISVKMPTQGSQFAGKSFLKNDPRNQKRSRYCIDVISFTIGYLL